MKIQDWFKIGMKRDIPDLIDAGTVQLNLGSGNTLMPSAVNLDLPEWDARKDNLPEVLVGTVDTIWASHFFENLYGDNAIRMLRECEKSLKVGGTINIVVPYYTSMMQHQDLTHCSHWCEETLRTLFKNHYYEQSVSKGEWKLNVHACFMMAIVERNLALFIQVVKTA
ncbi:hypothetical protein UFOVP1082_14 [uncultured Caudovirales phage]|uniref:Methyltransferase type 11 domain-containing protein n=1 Tax=uncultured Caudovirales phage TaxID=2100421 RepID=A0A6J5QKN2_9CAUD|nr:hypothetical protein UFOVP906_51 [uncultured Caudovirales phage]CAB4176297.1 hypothetical protein UFOVP992_18 [uncultured Caudovirales phage]CAB4183067.1 hypothetical protein UFOVP1082_14 [uncultured Caudovirales phage]CAB4198074.1 hypothetical protein UFOVP1322_58 [uncultured Caudovirales phage]CAB4212460.1 hypothetical protein UFOVP1434_21 [uncultured Caudovirales phage]